MTPTLGVGGANRVQPCICGLVADKATLTIMGVQGETISSFLGVIALLPHIVWPLARILMPANEHQRALRAFSRKHRQI